jgi:hypothetical protein
MALRSDWEIEIVSDWNEVYSEKFQQKWLKYIEEAIQPNIFFHPSLCMAWIETYRPIRNLTPHFCTARKDDTTVFIPLVLWRQNWKNAFRQIIVPVGFSDFDYHDPLVNRHLNYNDWQSFFHSLISHLKQKVVFDKIEFNGIRVKMSEDFSLKEDDKAPFCDLRSFSGSKEYLQNMGFNLRRNIQKQLKRINNLGPINLKHYKDIDDALYALSNFLEIHSLRWPNAYKAPLFHENLLRSGINAGIVDFSSLYSGDRILSYHLGFIDGNRYYCYMIAFNTDYEALSPAKIHLYLLVEYAFKHGYQTFDFLRGVENYKSGWTNNFEYLYNYYLVNDRISSKYKDFLICLKKQF